jgi:Fe-S cluster biogenesis protein NfuA
MARNLKLRRFILKEMADVLADDALFTKQTPQDDSPVGDVDDETVDEGGDCGCGCGGAPGGCGGKKSGTITATALFKRSLYEIIEDAIGVYDQYDDADQISDEMIAEIEHFSNKLKAFRN